MGTKNVYLNERPQLSIELGGGRSLGRCYSATYYKVTSLHPLSMKQLTKLREAGFLGYGQEFTVQQVLPDDKRCAVPAELDWRTSKDVQPTGVEDVQCVEVDEYTNAVTGRRATNPYTGEFYKASSTPYYVYACEDRVDSSD